MICGKPRGESHVCPDDPVILVVLLLMGRI
jgi:hypothetical protein